MRRRLQQAGETRTIKFEIIQSLRPIPLLLIVDFSGFIVAGIEVPQLHTEFPTRRAEDTRSRIFET